MRSVENAFKAMFPSFASELEVIGAAAASGVPDQPMGDEVRAPFAGARSSVLPHIVNLDPSPDVLTRLSRKHWLVPAEG